jgi:tetraacyldisaccharide-1-P 4'-kinase
MTIRHLVENAETYFTDLIREGRHTPLDALAMAVLFVLSRVYRNLVQLRITLYRQRILRPRTLGCLVVSIGNLTVGGTGKTPVVEVFSRVLTRHGRKVAVLSRGYRSRSKPWPQRLRDFFLRRSDDIPPRIVSDGKRLMLNSEMAGDEPYMLANNLKNVVVLVDKDRVKSGRYAITEFDADTLILDDGFQYLCLKPRLNILLIDSTTPFNNHHMLPRGLLREPIKNLRRADFIFLTKSTGGNHLRHLKGFIKKHNHHAEIIECTHEPNRLDLRYRGTGKLRSICPPVRRRARTLRTLCGSPSLFAAGGHRLRQRGDSKGRGHPANDRERCGALSDARAPRHPYNLDACRDRHPQRPGNLQRLHFPYLPASDIIRLTVRRYDDLRVYLGLHRGRTLRATSSYG